MHKALLASILTSMIAGLLLAAGCNKPPASSAMSSSPTGSAAPSTPAGGPLEQKLKELAGNGATNCGRLQSQAADQMDAAAQCAMKAAQEKRPFYVAYDLPGMTVAIAGNSQGKLFSVGSQGTNPGASPQTGSESGLASGDCPTSLRVAPSGRVTCFAPGTFPMGMGAGQSSHGSVAMPPAMGQNPHAATGSLPSGQRDPRQPKSATPPPKQP